MHTFRTWAPLARKMAVQVDGRRNSMSAAADHVWTANVEAATPGSDYGFIVDDEGPWPDPRSAFQPAGLRGLSRLVDHGAFHWTDAHWQAPPFSSAVIYELHTGTFAPEGTFDAIIPKLDHLAA